MTKKTVFERVYGLCIDGVPASKICRILRKDKGRISRIINALVDMGFLVCSNPRDRVRFYEATKKSLSPDDAVILSTYLREKSVKKVYPGYNMRCHGLSFRADVVTWGKELKWDKEWQTRGSHHYFYMYPFAGLGSVGFHRICSRSSDVLRVNLPNIRWNIERGSSVEQYIGNVAKKVLSWFCDQYHVSILNIRKCEGDSAGLPVRDRELVRLAQKRSVVFDDGFMLDASPPDNVPEFEGPIGKMAELLKSPSRLDIMEERVMRLEQSVDRVIAKIDAVSTKFDSLMKMFDAPRLPDERRDVT